MIDQMEAAFAAVLDGNGAPDDDDDDEVMADAPPRTPR